MGPLGFAASRNRLCHARLLVYELEFGIRKQRRSRNYGVVDPAARDRVRWMAVMCRKAAARPLE